MDGRWLLPRLRQFRTNDYEASYELWSGMWSVYLVNAPNVIQNVVFLLSECLFFRKDHIVRISDVSNLTSLIKSGPIYLVNALTAGTKIGSN